MLRASLRPGLPPITSIYNEAVTDFVGFLKSNKIDRVTSETVQNEIGLTLTDAVNRLVDRAAIRKAGQVRILVRTKCRERLPGLRSRIEVRRITGNEESVRKFYQSLQQNPVTRAKMQNVQKYKQKRGLMPEDSDMQILSDAIAIKQKNELMYFVSHDGHFTEFQQEIERIFPLKVLPVIGLLQFKTKLQKNIQEGNMSEVALP